MKLVLYLILSVVVLNIQAQVVNKKQVGDVTVVTTRAGTDKPVFSPNAIGYKYILQDTVLKQFDVELTIEEYVKGDVTKVDPIREKVTICRFASFELIPDIKPDNTLYLFFHWGRSITGKRIPQQEGFQYKWVQFSESISSGIGGSCPLLLVYSVKINDDHLEKTITSLVKSIPAKDMNKDNLVKRLRPVTDSFLILNYTKIIQNEKQ